MNTLIKIAIPLLVLLAGCSCPEIVEVSHDEITAADLNTHENLVSQHYWNNAQVEGIIWQPTRSVPGSPTYDRYGSGGDSALFTGFALAAECFKYQVTRSNADFDRVVASLRGLHILTHITGTPGVFARCAFPAHRQVEWQYPGHWQSRIDAGFVGTSPVVADPFNPGSDYPQMIYYTRSTKDQLTGVLYGLAVAWKSLQTVEPRHQARANELLGILAETVQSMHDHLDAHNFQIRNENGENDTNADSVSNRLKLGFLALYRHTVKITRPADATKVEEDYQDQFNSCYGIPFVWDGLVHRFNNYMQYYAWNLRYSRAFTTWLLEDDPAQKAVVVNYVETWLWPHTKDHQNAFFIFMHQAMAQNGDRVAQGVNALKSWSKKPLIQLGSPIAGQNDTPGLLEMLFGCTPGFAVEPHLRKDTSYFTWQKEPWDTGAVIDTPPVQDSTGLDFLLPYWLARRYSIIP